MHVIGTAGHVDHGKSTLVEKLTGMDPDRFAEEKRRGLTIDLGFAWLTTPSGREIGIIDVPGHERFIKNMLAGAGGISVCLFVVAANEGWMPQSAEHLAILDVLGIEHGVIAITKSDTVGPDDLELVVEETRRRLTATSLEGAAIVACSATEGTGLTELVAALDGVLDAAGPAEDVGRSRLWIDRVFTIAGAGTVVTGTLAGGGLKVGDAVEVSPTGRRGRIRAIQSHKKRVEDVGPGQRVALNLTGLDRAEVARGQAVVTPGVWRPTSRIDAEIRVLPEDVTGVRHELEEKGAHLFYCGTGETPVRISLLAGPIGPGERGPARLWLRDPLPLARGDRFVLRDAGRVLTFGGGRVLDPMPPSYRGPRADHLASLKRLGDADPSEALAILVESEGAIETSEALLRSGASAAEQAIELGGTLVSSSRFQALEERVVEEVERWHRDHPLERGIPRESLRAALDLDADAFDALIDRLDGVVADGPLVRLASFAVQLDPQQESRRAQLIDEIDSGGFSPPLAAELDAEAGLVRALRDAGDIVAVGDFFLSRRKAEEAKALVREAISSQGPMTVAQIRDLLGTTRKYAVPLCEWLDHCGATRRQKDVRVLGPRA